MERQTVKTAWIDARHPMSNHRLWGLTILERNVRELDRLGFTHVKILCPRDLNPLEHFCHPLPESLGISVAFEESKPFGSLIEQLVIQDAVLVLEGHAFNDRRIIEELMTTKSDCAVISPWGSKPSAAAILSARNVSLFENTQKKLTSILMEGIQQTQIARLDLSNFRNYIISLRREISPFLLRIENEQQLNEADDLLRKTVQKGVLDFIGKYIHPPLEFGLVKLIIHTPISPNMITIFWLILDGLAVLLFATGHLLPGCILAIISGILDGVDGKLARLTLRFSKTGDLLDHVGNAVFDAFWYLALGWYFSSGDFHSTAATFTAILIIAYTVERIVPAIFLKVHKAEIWDYEKIDIFVRLICSRMNNNIWVLTFGVLFGFPRETFYFISIWMLITAAWHTLRLICVSLKCKSAGA